MRVYLRDLRLSLAKESSFVFAMLFQYVHLILWSVIISRKEQEGGGGQHAHTSHM